MDEADRQAARRALARNWPDLAQASTEYAALQDALAAFHRRLGSDQFELRYNLRPPKDRTEQWTREVIRGQITEAEFGMRLKADAERPSPPAGRSTAPDVAGDAHIAVISQI